MAGDRKTGGRTIRSGQDAAPRQRIREKDTARRKTQVNSAKFLGERVRYYEAVIAELEATLSETKTIRDNLRERWNSELHKEVRK